MAWTGYSEQGAGSQERGPGRFALQVPGVVQQRALPTPAAARGGLQMGGIGGSVTSGPNQLNISPVQAARPAQLDPTFQTLLKLGGEFFADKVKKLEQERFVEGMHKAASGQALVEIINERPAWARVFGDGGAAEGARAYATEAAVSEWASSVQQSLPELRKRSPDEVPKLMIGMLDQFMTGDQQADVAIRSAMLKQVPALVKAHTREHLAWQQEEAVAQQARAFTSAAGAADKVMRDPRATPDDRAAALAGLNSTMAYVPGMNLETWSKNVEGVIKHAAQNNQFQILEAMQDPEKGVFGALPPELSATLKSYVREQAKRFRSDNPPQDLIIKGNLVMAQMEKNVITAQAGLEQLAAINAEYKATSGNVVDLFEETAIGASFQTSAKSFYAARQAEEERINRERAKAVEERNEARFEADREAGLVQAAYVGQLHSAIAKPKEKEDALAAAWRNAAGTDKGYAALTMNWQQNVLSDQVKGELQASWRASKSEVGPGPNFTTAYEQWKKFNFMGDGQARFGAAGASAAYFGAEQDSAMQLFHAMTAGGTNAEPAVAQMAWEATRRPKPELRKEQKEAGSAEVRKALSSGGIFGMFQDKPSDETVRKVFAAIEPMYGHYAQGLNPEQATAAALHAATGNGLEIYGDYVVQRAPGQKPLTVTGVTNEMMATVLQDTITERLKTKPFKDAKVTGVRRMPGTDVHLVVDVYDSKSETARVLNIRGNDLKAMYNRRQSAVDERASTEFGPRVTFRNPDDYPGIYASPAEMQAYRERQKQKQGK